jgi:CxxC-x17-CxxC domain-containing protein
MEYHDRNLQCKECGGSFVFTAGEQSFYAQKGFENDPVRCPECRKKRSGQFKKNNNKGKKLFDDVCDACHKHIQVPFKRTGTKPVYCQACMQKEKAKVI